MKSISLYWGFLMNILRAFSIAFLWSVWLYLWFFHQDFIDFYQNDPASMDFLGQFTLFFLFPPSAFLIYAFLYRPPYAQNTRASAWYLAKVIFLVLLDFLVLIAGSLSLDWFIYVPAIIFLNFIIIFHQKYNQIVEWTKFHQIANWRPEDRIILVKHAIKSRIFTLIAVIGFNIGTNRIAHGDFNLPFAIYILANIVLFIGYGITMSENRRWADRIADFLALVMINFLLLGILYLQWKYIVLRAIYDPIFLFLFFLSGIYLFLGYQAFITKSFASDYLQVHDSLQVNNLHRDTAKKLEKLNLDNSDSDASPISSQKFGDLGSIICPKCKLEITTLHRDIIKHNAILFCPHCGAKLMRYELIHLSEAELISEQQQIIDKLDQKLMGNPKSP